MTPKTQSVSRKSFKEIFAIIFWRHRKLWTVVYPDGQQRTKCELAVAKDYKELFGGKVVFRG